MRNNPKPVVADFFAKQRPGISPVKDFLLALRENEPTLMPKGLSRAVIIRHRQNTIHAAAKRAGIMVRTIARDDEVWVLRLPNQGDGPASKVRSDG